YPTRNVVGNGAETVLEIGHLVPDDHVEAERFAVSCVDIVAKVANNHDRVNEADILAGHFQSTRDRTLATDDLVLVLHDTTEFTYRREKSEAIGITKSVNSGRDKAGRLRSHTVCGILMHSSLAVTIEGVPLGLAAVKFWTRKKFRGTAALKKKINPTRIPIEKKESIRWLENLKQS